MPEKNTKSSPESINRFFQWAAHSVVLYFVVLVALAIFASLVLPISLRPTPSILKVGDVAFQDIRAPRDFSFESELLTEQARDEAEKGVTPIYLPADPSISRKQVEKLKNILSFINSDRQDEFATRDQKIQDLTAITDLQLTAELAENIINLNDTDWEAVQSESLFLLEEVMKSPIREDQVATFRRNLAPQIGFEFNSTESDIISILVSPLIVANSLFSNESTAEKIAEVRGRS